MDIKIIYPHIENRAIKRKKLINVLEVPILLAAVICPIINIVLGGKAWSIIVLTALYIVHTLVLSPDLVEYNRISQFIKFIICLCVLLVLIDLFVYPYPAILATSVICCCGLIVSAALFITDLKRQKKNIFPMLLFLLFSVIRAAAGIIMTDGEVRASFFFMEILSITLLIIFAIILGKFFIRELHCIFHIK